MEGTIDAEGLYVFEKFILEHKGANSPPYQSHSSTFSSRKNSTQAFVSANSNLSASLWHLKLGYPSSIVVNKVLATCNLKTSKNTFLFPYNACMKGKAHRLPYHASNMVYPQPL